MLRAVLLVILSAALCACGNESSTSPAQSVAPDPLQAADGDIPEPLIAAIAPGVPPSADTVVPVNPAKPNLVLIMTDDQTVRDLAAMPWTLQLLRNQGLAFSNSFVSWPLCCPSRATLFTGQYAHNHNVLGNYPPDGSAQAFTTDAESLPVWLQRAGYRTIHIGKYLNYYGADNRGSSYVPPGWSDWMGLVDPNTYQMWGYTVNHNGVSTTYGSRNVEDPKLYQTDVLTQLALNAIDQSAGQPFFLSFAPLAPHEEIQETTFGIMPGPRPAPRHAGSFGWVPLPQPLGFDEADLSDKPPIIALLASIFGSDPMPLRVSRYRRRLESLRAVDEAVWWILVKLQSKGMLDNTYVVFTSDNGWFNGEHHIDEGKYLLYEPSIRVPLLIRGPGVPAGAISPELVANVDLAPTFVELAGATAGRVMDGRSLMPFVRNPNLTSGRPILLDAPHEQVLADAPGKPVVPIMRGLRTRRFAYVEYGTGDTELYDLFNDPGEMASVHADPAYSGWRAGFHAALQKYQGCAGDACRAEITGPMN